MLDDAIFFYCSKYSAALYLLLQLSQGKFSVLPNPNIKVYHKGCVSINHMISCRSCDISYLSVCKIKLLVMDKHQKDHIKVWAA